MKRALASLLFITVLYLPFSSDAVGEVLGFGIECESGVITRNAEVLTSAEAYGVASNVQKRLRRRRKNLKQKGLTDKAQRITKRIKKWRGVVRQLQACTSGGLEPGLAEYLASVEGVYKKGRYQFLVDGTPVVGNTYAEFSLDGIVLSGLIRLDGIFVDIFGSGEATFTENLQGRTLPLEISIPSSPLGPLVLTLAADGKVDIDASDVGTDELKTAEYSGYYEESRGFDGLIVFRNSSGASVLSGTMSLER